MSKNWVMVPKKILKDLIKGKQHEFAAVQRIFISVKNDIFVILLINLGTKGKIAINKESEIECVLKI